MCCQYLELELTFWLEILLFLLQLLILKCLLDLGAGHFSTRCHLLLGSAFQPGIFLIQKSLVFLLPLQELKSLLLLVILQWQKAASSKNHVFEQRAADHSTSFANVPLTSEEKASSRTIFKAFGNKHYEVKQAKLNGTLNDETVTCVTFTLVWLIRRWTEVEKEKVNDILLYHYSKVRQILRSKHKYFLCCTVDAFLPPDIG